MILSLSKQRAIFARLDCFDPNCMNPITGIFGSRETLQAIIDEIANPIFVKDRSHRLVLVNKNFCEFLGRQKRDVIGKSDFDLVSKEQAEVFLRTDNYVFETGA